MTSRADFTTNGFDPAGAYMEGVDANTKRAQGAQTFADQTAINAEKIRGLKTDNSNAEYNQQRTRSIDTQADEMAANVPGAGGAPNPAAPPAQVPSASTATGVAPAGSPAAQAQPIPNAAPGGVDTTGSAIGTASPQGQQPQQLSMYQQQAQQYRREAALNFRLGKFEAANKANASAVSADMEHITSEAEKVAASPDAWQKAAAMVNQRDPSLTIATDKSGRSVLTIVQPNGNATAHALTEVDKKRIVGAQALMEKGYVNAALGIFAQVDANLAAEVGSRNAQTTGVAAANNKVAHEESADTSARITANAHMVSASAQRDRNSMDKYGTPVQMIDPETKEAVLMVPTRSSSGGFSMEKVDTQGMRFAKQPSDTKFIKNGDGQVATDGATGKPLYAIDADNHMRPIAPDPWAGKGGGPDDKKIADMRADGIERKAVFDNSGQLGYVYWNVKNPDTQYTTPEEALADVAKGKQQAGSGVAMDTQMRANRQVVDTDTYKRNQLRGAQQRSSEQAGAARGLQTR